MSWIYRKREGHYEVGYFAPFWESNNLWHDFVVEGKYERQEDAAARVNYLNGGASLMQGSG